MNYGFFRVAAVSPKLKVASPTFNAKEIIKSIELAASKGAKLLVTPELSITGYTCADLFFTDSLYEQAIESLKLIKKCTSKYDMAVIVGMPFRYLNKLYNCAVVISNGKILGVVPKQYIANYNEFYEKRWFASGKDFSECKEINLCSSNIRIGSQLFDLGNGVILGVEICEDLWAPCPPSSELALQGANLIVNLSASDEYVSKNEYRRDLIRNQSARCISAYLYSGASVCESTTDLLYGGPLFIAENGTILDEGERFSRESAMIISDVDIEKLNHLRMNNSTFENHLSSIPVIFSEIRNEENDLLYRNVDKMPFVPSNTVKRSERCREIIDIQANALATRISYVGSDGVIIGLSGGLDSTLALLVSCRSMEILGKNNKSILCVTMPGFGTTDSTLNNALNLAKSLGAEIKTVDIKDACNMHLKDIGHSVDTQDITYENSQARERTQILFDMANLYGKLLVGTGDLSELAMGWCTYNADQMSMYAVNASIPKTLVRYLIEYMADTFTSETSNILHEILETPISPELLPPDKEGNIAQKTEEVIGKYDLIDFILYNFIRFGFSKKKLKFIAKKAFSNIYSDEYIENEIDIFFKRFFSNQFKRSCMPDAPKVGSVSLSPRGDWRMPSDAEVEDYLK